MSTVTVPCVNPEICGVREHIAGSDAHIQCTRTTASRMNIAQHSVSVTPVTKPVFLELDIDSDRFKAHREYLEEVTQNEVYLSGDDMPYLTDNNREVKQKLCENVFNSVEANSKGNYYSYEVGEENLPNYFDKCVITYDDENNIALIHISADDYDDLKPYEQAELVFGISNASFDNGRDIYAPLNPYSTRQNGLTVQTIIHGEPQSSTFKELQAVCSDPQYVAYCMLDESNNEIDRQTMRTLFYAQYNCVKNSLADEGNLRGIHCYFDRWLEHTAKNKYREEMYGIRKESQTDYYDDEMYDSSVSFIKNAIDDEQKTSSFDQWKRVSNIKIENGVERIYFNRTI